MKTQQGDSFGARRKLGGLLAGWATVTGVAATFATALYASTGDRDVILLWVGFPTVVFTLLILLVGLGYAATQAATPARKRQGSAASGEGVRHTRRQTPYGSRR